MAEPRKPFWVKCPPCGHVWAAAYAPMEMGAFGRLLAATRCPNCGSGPKGILIAKQKEGVLNEPLGSHQTGAQA